MGNTPGAEQNAVEEFMLNYQPERYWAVWQIPESRYAYMISEDLSAWFVLLATEVAGMAYLRSDAVSNGRTLDQYRLDEITMADAFDAARIQPTPFMSSLGYPVRTVLGIELVQFTASGFLPLGRYPL